MSDEWIQAESVPVDEADPKALLRKWANVAEDMALIPELNVRMRVEAGMFVVDVSPELYDVFH
ncbi:MAG: hypothetical protein RDU24_07390 [Humidesulfovibrio sp.]|uniref:hypothetical protein n=1 Tax=Humidesulfovibrio sp. TaxID=2910988 RepID=UPI0027EB3896|nr:hypothetical protein [Humidesulfovibrio sp.]MDQ7835191.1 hypothetical protein [Humidesulfovibrio sp.]